MRAMDEHFRITDELWARESARFLVAVPEGFDPTELLKAQGGPLTNGGPSKKSKPSGSSRRTPSQPKDERAKR
jgi:hypothetical protein